MAEKLLITITEVHEDQLPKDNIKLSQLTDLLDEITGKLAPQRSLDLDRAYLVSPYEKDALISFLEEHALPFHTYAVDREGVCREPDCEIHTPGASTAIVVQLHDRRPSAQRPHKAPQAPEE